MAAREQFTVVAPDANAESDDNYETQKNILSIKLRSLLKTIIIIALHCVAVVFIILSVRLIVDKYFIQQAGVSLADLQYFINFAIIGTMQLLCAIPYPLIFAILLNWRQKGYYTLRLRKFLQYQLTVNLTTTIFSFISAVAIQDIPISLTQVLFVNLIYGGLATIALMITINPGEIDVKNEPLLVRHLTFKIIGQGIYQVIVLLIIVFYGERLFDIPNGRWAPLHSPPSVHFALVFNMFGLMTIFNMINARKGTKEHNVFQNIHRDFWFIGAFAAVLIIHVVTLQFGCDFLSTVPLDCLQWLWCIACAFGGLLLQQILILIPL